MRIDKKAGLNLTLKQDKKTYVAKSYIDILDGIASLVCSDGSRVYIAGNYAITDELEQ